MEFLKKPAMDKNKLIIFTVVVGLAIGLYFGFKAPLPETLTKLPAALTAPANGTATNETIVMQEDFDVEARVAEQREKGKYIEEAVKGDGVTHLARRAVKSYLQENAYSSEMTPQHKVYAEDYIAKRIGDKSVQLGEKLEFSEDLIKEALDKSAELTPQQLDNLTQYSQLVPSLNY